MIKLYFRYFSIHLRSTMQYKVSFFLTMAGQFLTSFSSLLGIWFLFARFHNVDGFRFEEVLICFSTVLMGFSLAEWFFRGFDAFKGIISNGEFDRIMVRPRNVLFQVMGARIEFTRLGRTLQAVLVLIYAICASGIVWTPDRIFTLVFMIVGTFFLYCGLFMINASLCFFTIERLEVMNIFTDGSKEFGSYPLSIYGKHMLRFFTYILPIACVQYYPLLYLLGKSGSVFYMLLPAAGILFLLPSYALWRIGVRHYKSTGS
jgi:ABC-2 type transport system permease protein